MSYTFGQAAHFDTTTGVGAFSGAVSAGSILLLFARPSTDAPDDYVITGVSDSVNGAWSPIDISSEYEGGGANGFSRTVAFAFLNAAASAAPTVTITTTGGTGPTLRWTQLEFRGGSALTRCVAHNNAIATGAATTWGTGSLTVTDHDLVVAGGSTSSNTTSLAATSPLTLRDTGTKVWAADLLDATAQSTAFGGTIGVQSHGTGSVTLVFREVMAPPPQSPALQLLNQLSL